MEWKKPEIRSFTEQELIEKLEVKAQTHGDHCDGINFHTDS